MFNMNNEIKVFDSKKAAAQLGMNRAALLVWLQRNPEYYPPNRISGDDLLWTPEDIERVRVERDKPGKGRRRRG